MTVKTRNIRLLKIDKEIPGEILPAVGVTGNLEIIPCTGCPENTARLVRKEYGYIAGRGGFSDSG